MSDLGEAIREGFEIIERAMRHANRTGRPRPPCYLLKCEWDWINLELEKRESPLHRDFHLDEDGCLRSHGVELRKIEFIPREGK